MHRTLEAAARPARRLARRGRAAIGRSADAGSPFGSLGAKSATARSVADCDAAESLSARRSKSVVRCHVSIFAARSLPALCWLTRGHPWRPCRPNPTRDQGGPPVALPANPIGLPAPGSRRHGVGRAAPYQPQLMCAAKARRRREAARPGPGDVRPRRHQPRDAAVRVGKRIGAQGRPRLGLDAEPRRTRRTARRPPTS